MGPAALADRELLAVVFGAGTRRLNALAMSAAVLDASGGLHGLLQSSWEELRSLPGVGPARAAQVLAAVELGRRTLLREPDERSPLRTPKDVAAYLLPGFGARPVEQFGIVLLDTKHRLLKTVVLTIGTIDRSVVHPREVFREPPRPARRASSLFRNHPSGDPAPSTEDVALTRRLKAAGTLMGIDVVNHLILTATRYCSLRETGQL